MLTWGVNANIWFLITYSLEVPNTPICRCGRPLNFMFLFRPVKKKKKTSHWTFPVWFSVTTILDKIYFTDISKAEDRYRVRCYRLVHFVATTNIIARGLIKNKNFGFTDDGIGFFNYSHCSAPKASPPKSTGGGTTFLKEGHQHTTENAVLSR